MYVSSVCCSNVSRLHMLDHQGRSHGSITKAIFQSRSTVSSSALSQFNLHAFKLFVPLSPLVDFSFVSFSLFYKFMLRKSIRLFNILCFSSLLTMNSSHFVFIYTVLNLTFACKTNHMKNISIILFIIF